MLSKTSCVSSIDNSGSFANKILQVYGSCFASAGSIILVLPFHASFRKRIRRSKFYRAVCVQARSFVFRKTGFYIRSWLNSCVLIKTKERLCTPLSNRVSGFLFAEIRFIRYSRLLSLTVYILLLIKFIF